MKIIELNQGTPEWHLWRKDGIGASDISAIMRTGNYGGPISLWNKKLGFTKDEPYNKAIEYGIQNEPVARNWINKNLKLFLKPCCVQDDQEDIFRASLDGWDFDQNILVEIKCPISEQKLDNARDHKMIPVGWYDQVQWQIMLTKASKAYLAMWDFREQRPYMIEQYRDEARIELMKKEALKFWSYIQNGVEPPRAKKRSSLVQEDDILLDKAI